MLVLTRKQSETIHIGDDVVIKVIQTGRGSIKIGIEAPTAVRILRGEVVEAAQHADQLAESSPAQPSTRAALPTRPANKAGKHVHMGAV